MGLLAKFSFSATSIGEVLCAGAAVELVSCIRLVVVVGIAPRFWRAVGEPEWVVIEFALTHNSFSFN